MTASRLLTAAAILTLATAGHAAVLCAARAGALFVRDACRKRETPADVAALGALLPKGPRGSAGSDGAPGPARGSAHVAPNGTFVGTADHLATVTTPQSGVFCIVPDDTIDPATSLALAVPEYGYSSGSELAVYVQFPVAACAEGTFEVRTVDLSGVPSTYVAFHFLVI